jgi:hypothetical protein
MRVVALLLVIAACANTQHASVPLANNPTGADCFTRCIAATSGQPAVDCVAACPGATHDSGDCEGALGCVEDRVPRRGATTWLIIAGIVSVAVLYFVAGGGP